MDVCVCVLEGPTVSLESCNRFLSSYAIGWTFVLFGISAPAAGQVVTGVVAAASVAGASGVVEDISEKAGNEGNYVVFTAAAQMRLLIENFRIAARDVLTAASGDLNNSQQQMFDNIQKGVKSLQQAASQPMEQG